MRVKPVIWNDDTPLLPCWDETLACALSSEVCRDMPQAADHYLYHRDELAQRSRYYAPRELLAVGIEGSSPFATCWVLVNRNSHECVLGMQVDDNEMVRLEFQTLAHVRQFVERITGLIVDFDEPTDEEADAYMFCAAFARRWRFF